MSEEIDSEPPTDNEPQNVQESNESETNSVNEVESTDKSEEKKAEEKKIKLRKPLNHSLLEALFYASGRPISVNRIAIEFGWEPKEITKMVKDLAKKLDKTKAELRLLEIQRGRWVLHLPLDKQDLYFKSIVETILIEYPKRNIHNTLVKKVLTAVAFHQPVSKPRLFKILSAEDKEMTIQKLESILDILAQEGYVRSNISGSIQYKTTGSFAEEFGLDPVKLKLKQQLIRRMEKSGKR